MWILRLVYAGLNFEDDAKIYMKNSILETLMSFYVSPISDDESKELILQVTIWLVLMVSSFERLIPGSNTHEVGRELDVLD